MKDDLFLARNLRSSIVLIYQSWLQLYLWKSGIHYFKIKLSFLVVKTKSRLAYSSLSKNESDLLMIYCRLLGNFMIEVEHFPLIFTRSSLFSFPQWRFEETLHLTARWRHGDMKQFSLSKSTARCHSPIRVSSKDKKRLYLWCQTDKFWRKQT